jgi:hypothetical protein
MSSSVQPSCDDDAGNVTESIDLERQDSARITEGRDDAQWPINEGQAAEDDAVMREIV